MTGTTPNGIRYPDPATKVKNLGAELATMAGDIDGLIETEIGASSPIFQEKAAAAAGPAVDAAISGRNIPELRRRVSELNGFVGENGVPTELVVDGDGSVPAAILEDQADRIGGLRPRTGAHLEMAGALVGENGVPTELAWTTDGLVPSSVQKAQAARLRAQHPLASVSGGRGLVTRSMPPFVPLVPTTATVAFWGDSMFEGFPKPPFTPELSVPGRFAVHSGIAVYNGGRSGQSCDEIAFRNGASVVYFSVDGGTIPAAGAVTVTTTQQIGWRPTMSLSPVPGTLHGRTGMISRNASNGIITFTPTDGAAASSALGAAPFVSEDGDAYKSAMTFVIAGRNDVNLTSAGTADIDRIVTATALIVEGQAARHHRTGLLGVMNAVNEPSGTSAYRTVRAVEAALMSTWPEFWTGTRDYLVSAQCYTDQGIATDATAIAQDRPGTALMADNLHWSTATANLIAAHLFRWANSKGWL